MHGNTNEWDEVYNFDGENCSRIFEAQLAQMSTPGGQNRQGSSFDRIFWLCEVLGCGTQLRTGEKAPEMISRANVLYLIPKGDLWGDTKGYNPLVDLQGM